MISINSRCALLVILATLGLITYSTVSFAQSGNGYDLTWSTIDGGGVTFSMGNGYELGGTIGQPDAEKLSGGGYELNGGFWQATAESGLPCVTAADCRLDPPNNACNHASCAGTCSYTCIKFGDIKNPPNGVVNIDDILCSLAGFAALANCPDADINPCGGNGVINLDDILSVLSAFAGANECGCDAAGSFPPCGSNSP